MDPTQAELHLFCSTHRAEYRKAEDILLTLYKILKKGYPSLSKNLHEFEEEEGEGEDPVISIVSAFRANRDGNLEKLLGG